MTMEPEVKDNDDTRRCASCGADLPAEDEGLCPACGAPFGLKTMIMPAISREAIEQARKKDDPA